MRILVAGDTHGNLGHVEYLFRVAKFFDVDRIVQLGDFGFWPMHRDGVAFLEGVAALSSAEGVPFFWIDGNHEDHDYLDSVVLGERDNFVAMPFRSGEIFYAPRGMSWRWGGVGFLAVGGASSIDRHSRQEGLDWFPQELISDHDVEIASSSSDVDVIFSHDVPSSVDIALRVRHFIQEDETKVNRERLQKIVSATTPSILFHGHYHTSYNDTVDGVNVIGLSMDGTRGSSFHILDTRDVRGLQ